MSINLKSQFKDFNANLYLLEVLFVNLQISDSKGSREMFRSASSKLLQLTTIIFEMRKFEKSRVYMQFYDLYLGNQYYATCSTINLSKLF